MADHQLIHVCPPDDILDHDRVSHTCWCRPAYDIRYDRTVVYHNRADELQEYSFGYTKPQEQQHARLSQDFVPAKG